MEPRHFLSTHPVMPVLQEALACFCPPKGQSAVRATDPSPRPTGRTAGCRGHRLLPTGAQEYHARDEKEAEPDLATRHHVRMTGPLLVLVRPLGCIDPVLAERGGLSVSTDALTNPGR